LAARRGYRFGDSACLRQSCADGQRKYGGAIKVDKSSCPSKGNLYVAFTAPDNVTENTNTGPQRSVYVGVSTDAGLNAPTMTFSDRKVYTSPAGSPGAIHGTNQIFPALAVDNFGYVYTCGPTTRASFCLRLPIWTSWTAPVRVNAGTTIGKSNVFPWAAADANGHVVVTCLEGVSRAIPTM